MEKILTEELKGIFSSLDYDIKYSISQLKKPLLLGLTALIIAEDQGNTQYLTSKQIEECLEKAGTSEKNIKISRAFARAGNKVKRILKDGESYYRIMMPGRNVITPLLCNGPIRLVRIEAGKPLTARENLVDILKTLKGVVMISDPYLGVKSFESLRHIPSTYSIKMLTENIEGGLTSFSVNLLDFKKEHPNIEFRKISQSGILHDRFILTADSIYFLGQGIKDIGNKESFIIVIPNSLAMDIYSQTRKNFTEHWDNAVVI